MTSQEAIDLLKSVGAIITNDHLVYTTGKHGSVYINKDALYPFVDKTSALCAELARQVATFKPEVVVSPVLGGVVLTQWVAHHLGEQTGVAPLAVFAEKVTDGLVLKRGYADLVVGKRVVVLEDTTNTGRSALRAVTVVREAGGHVVGVGVLVNRQPTVVNSQLYGAPFVTVAEFPAEVFDADRCPLCAQGVPINTEVGHGKQFLAAKGHV